MSVVTPEKLSALIERVYSCATDALRWPETLQAINEATKCHASVIGVVSFEQNYSVINSVAGFDEAFSKRYESNLPALSAIWGGNERIASREINQPVVLSLDHPRALVRRSEQHDLLCDVLGFEVEDTLNLPLSHKGKSIGAAGFARRVGQGVFEPATCQLFRCIAPHLSRSAEISRLLDGRSLHDEVRDSLFEHLRSPVVVVDGARRLVQHNRNADPLLGRLGWLGGKDKPMVLDRALADAVDAVTGRRESYRCVTSGASVPGHSPIHVLALRASDGTQLRGLAAIVVMPGAPSSGAASVRLLGEGYGLTRAENDVLAELANGSGTDAIAAKLNVRRSTVRSHVLKVFDKFGVHDRVQLVARIQSSTPPFEPLLHQMADEDMQPIIYH